MILIRRLLLFMFLACFSHGTLDLLSQGILGLVLETALAGSYEQKESHHNLLMGLAFLFIHGYISLLIHLQNAKTLLISRIIWIQASFTCLIQLINFSDFVLGCVFRPALGCCLPYT